MKLPAVEELELRRKDHGLTKAQMASAMGISTNLYSRLESGNTKFKKLYAVAFLCVVQDLRKRRKWNPVCADCGRNTHAPLFDGCMNKDCYRGYKPCL